MFFVVFSCDFLCSPAHFHRVHQNDSFDGRAEQHQRRPFKKDTGEGVVMDGEKVGKGTLILPQRLEI